LLAFDEEDHRVDARDNRRDHLFTDLIQRVDGELENVAPDHGMIIAGVEQPHRYPEPFGSGPNVAVHHVMQRLARRVTIHPRGDHVEPSEARKSRRNLAAQRNTEVIVRSRAAYTQRLHSDPQAFPAGRHGGLRRFVQKRGVAVALKSAHGRI
jgi:hypothetical protein